MNTFVTAVVVSLAVGFSGTSFADTEVFGVKTPVGHTVSGSYVETDHTSFYTSPKEMNEVTSSFKDRGDGRDYMVVFGVNVPVDQRI